MKRYLLVLALVGCGKGTKEQAAPAGSNAGSAAGSAATAPDAACTESTKKLGEWLADLNADGPLGQTVDPSMTKLVKLDDMPASELPRVPTLVITPTTISLDGKMLEAIPLGDKGKGLTDAFAAAPKSDALNVLVDGAAPWSAVAATTSAAASAGSTKLTFVFFSAPKTGKATTPAPSAVDKDFEELNKPADPSKETKKLGDPASPSIPDKVFKDCPSKDVLTKIGGTDWPDKGKVIVDEIPRMVAACNCKVEMASVQRLMWSWYGRDLPPVTGMTLEIAKGGAPVTAKPTDTWEAASKAVVAAAKAGKPVTIK